MGGGGFGNLVDWINPAKSIPALFSKDTAFGLDPLNITGVDPDRSSMTAPGTNDLKEANDALVAEEVVTVEDPAVAAAALSEEARQEEMRKRRIRSKTLLSDQTEQGTATVGTKVLLGG